MRKFLAFAVVSTALLTAGAAAAQVRQHQIALPDGSTYVAVTTRDGGWFRSGETTSAQFHCNPTCTPVDISSASAPGALPGIVQSLIGGFSVVRAYEVRRPDETHIDNSSESDSESYSDSYSDSDVEVDQDTNVETDIENESYNDTYVEIDF